MAQSTRARGAAQSARPYVQRLIEDEDLRDSLREALKAAKHAYARMSNGKGPARAMMEDRKLHRDLRVAAESLRDASDSLRNGRAKKRHPFRKLLVIGILSAALALVLSEDLRKAVLDRLFGAEEEFEYTSTTTASTSADEVTA
jgi:hypothetical protein